jgi:hypothetical protein
MFPSDALTFWRHECEAGRVLFKPSLVGDNQTAMHGNRQMCGRFTLRTPTKDIVKAFGLTDALDLKPRFNIAPTQQIAAIKLDPETGTSHNPLVFRCSRCSGGRIRCN